MFGTSQLMENDMISLEVCQRLPVRHNQIRIRHTPKRMTLNDIYELL